MTGRSKGGVMKNEFDKFDELLELPEVLNLTDFENYIRDYLERKADKNLAIQELDKLLAILQNHIISLSLYLKQNHLFQKFISPQRNEEIFFYTKQEVAMKYRVSVRTVTNWIIDGLEVENVGGVKRISNEALNAFVHSKKTKKFRWRSSLQACKK